MIFSIDPSISCTGYGLIEWPSASFPQGRVVECGAITPPDSGSAWERIRRSLVMELNELAESLMDTHSITTVVVETPQDYAVGLNGKRSAATLPTYGMAVGVVLPKSMEKAAGAADALLIGRWCMLERKRNRVG